MIKELSALNDPINREYFIFARKIKSYIDQQRQVIVERP